MFLIIHFPIYQFDTLDFQNIYCLVSNTLRGDISTDENFNKNIIYRFDTNDGTWTPVIDVDDGQPQLARQIDIFDDVVRIADNTKNLQVVSRNNKTLIFFRRVATSTAGIAYQNDTDDILTDVYSETYGSNDGLPYSMDFVLDERSDGIHVYTFVVKYSFSGTSFSSATLKVFRKRVEPDDTQSEIFSETFSNTTGDDDYPFSVSDVILADDRSKFYFVLGYANESSTDGGKSELCEIAKGGSGSRTVLKTYDDPLVGPRSPVKRGTDYFYLEGNWYRRATDDDDVPDKFYYPNEGGHLIEIESNGDITDHGVIWRSRTKLDSPDPDPETHSMTAGACTTRS